MDKNVRISMLLEIYAKLLTQKQSDLVDLYYNQNLSLSEIADEVGVTRQAVRKSIVEAEKNLLDLEEKLGILDKQLRRKEKIDQILRLEKDKKIAKLIEELNSF